VVFLEGEERKKEAEKGGFSYSDPDNLIDAAARGLEDRLEIAAAGGRFVGDGSLHQLAVAVGGDLAGAPDLPVGSDRLAVRPGSWIPGVPRDEKGKKLVCVGFLAWGVEREGEREEERGGLFLSHPHGHYTRADVRSFGGCMRRGRGIIFNLRGHASSVRTVVSWLDIFAVAGVLLYKFCFCFCFVQICHGRQSSPAPRFLLHGG
jgi:hypothetical protein